MRFRGTRKQKGGQYQTSTTTERMTSFGGVGSLGVSYTLTKPPRQTVDKTRARLMLGFCSSVFLTTDTPMEEGAGLALEGEKTMVGQWPGHSSIQKSKMAI